MLKKRFSILFTSITLICLMALLLYFPARYVIGLILPGYKDSLQYFAILLPIFIFDAKVLLLSNTYLKALRRESSMLVINGISVLISAFFSFSFSYIYKSIDLMVFSLPLVLYIRSLMLNLFTAKILKVKLGSIVLQEIIVIILYLMIVINLNLINGFLVYLVVVVSLLLLNKPNIKNILRIREKGL